jgi:hypothetical protein
MRYIFSSSNSVSSPSLTSSSSSRKRCTSAQDGPSSSPSYSPTNEPSDTIDLVIIALSMCLTVLLSTSAPTIHLKPSRPYFGSVEAVMVFACSLCYNSSAIAAYGYSQALYNPQCCAACAAATAFMVTSWLVQTSFLTRASRNRLQPA